MLSCVQLLVISWTVACQAPLSMEFSRQEYWSGQPFPSPGDLPDPGTGPTSAQLDSLLLGHLGSSKRGEGELQFSNPFCKGVVAMLLSHFSHVWLFVTLWTVACQAPLSMEFSRQEYWSGLPFPSPGDLPDLGLNPGLLHCRQIFTVWNSYCQITINWGSFWRSSISRLGYVLPYS